MTRNLVLFAVFAGILLTALVEVLDGVVPESGWQRPAAKLAVIFPAILILGGVGRRFAGPRKDRQN